MASLISQIPVAARIQPDNESPVLRSNNLRECILNRTLIDKITNIRIGKRAPSDYLMQINKELLDDKFEQMVASHLLPSGTASPLFLDRFEEFLSQREQLLWEKIVEVTS